MSGFVNTKQGGERPSAHLNAISLALRNYAVHAEAAAGMRDQASPREENPMVVEDPVTNLSFARVQRSQWQVAPSAVPTYAAPILARDYVAAAPSKDACGIPVKTAIVPPQDRFTTGSDQFFSGAVRGANTMIRGQGDLSSVAFSVMKAEIVRTSEASFEAVLVRVLSALEMVRSGWRAGAAPIGGIDVRVCTKDNFDASERAWPAHQPLMLPESWNDAAWAALVSLLVPGGPGAYGWTDATGGANGLMPAGATVGHPGGISQWLLVSDRPRPWTVAFGGGALNIASLELVAEKLKMAYGPEAYANAMKTVGHLNRVYPAPSRPPVLHVDRINLVSTSDTVHFAPEAGQDSGPVVPNRADPAATHPDANLDGTGVFAVDAVMEDGDLAVLGRALVAGDRDAAEEGIDPDEAVAGNAATRQQIAGRNRNRARDRAARRFESIAVDKEAGTLSVRVAGVGAPELEYALREDPHQAIDACGDPALARKAKAIWLRVFRDTVAFAAEHEPWQDIGTDGEDGTGRWTRERNVYGGVWTRASMVLPRLDLDGWVTVLLGIARRAHVGVSPGILIRSPSLPDYCNKQAAVSHILLQRAAYLSDVTIADAVVNPWAGAQWASMLPDGYRSAFFPDYVDRQGFPYGGIECLENSSFLGGTNTTPYVGFRVDGSWTVNAARTTATMGDAPSAKTRQAFDSALRHALTDGAAVRFTGLVDVGWEVAAISPAPHRVNPFAAPLRYMADLPTTPSYSIAYTSGLYFGPGDTAAGSTHASARTV